jgi:sulfoxide reductase heme-binding subunit YedZ
VGVDLMLAVAVSSALRQRISPRIWRGIHWLAYGSWPVAMAHSLGTGTDASTLWFDALAALCTVAVLWALAWRIADHRRSHERARLVGATTRVVPRRTTLRLRRPDSVPVGTSITARSSRSISPSHAAPPTTVSSTGLLEKDRP